MNADIKKEWIKLLKGKKYSKSDFELREGNTFSFLGVLCDLHSKKTGTKWEGELYFKNAVMPPMEVLTWAEIPPGLIEPLPMKILVECDFKTMAKWVQSNL